MMVKLLLALCIVTVVQARLIYEVKVPVFRQPYGINNSPKISGGETATHGQFPYQAGLYVDGDRFCGGSLISKNWVLTAGHCIYWHRLWKVYLGAHYIRESEEPGREIFTSTEAIMHEMFDYDEVENDIGVIRLPKEVQLSNYISLIKLPPRSLVNENLAGKTARVSGWGYTKDTSLGISPELQFVDMSLITNKECAAVYGKVPETQYCCRGADQKNICGGDSGGPLTIRFRENLVNLGVVSYGSSRGCHRGDPSGFTAVPFFVDWISNKTGIVVQA